MSYVYETEKQWMFTEKGQIAFLKIRDRIKGLLEDAGAFSMGCAISDSTGDGWALMACV